MELNIQKDTHRFYSSDKWMPITKFIPSIFLGIGLGGILFYCLIKQFYFYQVIVVAIVCVPVALLLLVYSPRRSLLGLLILIIPFNPCFHILRDDQSIAFGPELNFWTSDLIVIVIFFFLIISYAFGRKNRQHPHAQIWWSGLPLLIWIAAGVVSILPAANKSIAIVEMLRMFRIFLIFVAIYLLVERFEDIRFIATCLVIAFAIQGVLVFAEYGLSHPLFRLPGEVREADIVGTILRPGGTMGHSANFAKLAALCLPICFAFMLTLRKNIWRLSFSAILISGLIALILTVSRAGLATSIFGLIWILLIMQKKKSGGKIKILAPMILLVIGIVLAWHVAGSRLISRSKEDFGSALSRPEMFSVAWNVIKDHPFVGVGLNNYTLVAPDYDHTRDAISISYPHPVHNIYLLHAAEIGIIGAVFFIWFLFGTVAMAFKRSLESRSLLDSAITKAIGIGITCSWLQGLISWGFRASIVHTSYLAVIAGALATLKHYNQNRNAGYLNGT